MQLGATFPQTEIGTDPGAIRAYAQAAEELGYDYLLAYDHVIGADVSARPDRIAAQMRDPALRQVLRDELKTDTLGLGDGFNWDRVVLVRSSTGRYAQYEGRTVPEIGAALGKDPLDTAFDMGLDEDLDTHFRLAVPATDDEVTGSIIKSPHVAAGVSDAGAHIITECNTAFPTHLLSYWVREKQALSLEEAVRSISGIPAEETGLRDRGSIQEGMAADITLFDPETIAPGERVFVNDMPGGAERLVHYAQGIEYTLVNGQITQERGKPTGALSGTVLRNTRA